MYIAIDIGGTKTIAAGFRSLNPKEKISEVTFPTEQKFEKGFSLLKLEIERLRNDSKIHAIGICLPGEIKNGDLYGASNLRNWENKKIAYKLKKTFNCKVKLAQDSTCAALADIEFGNVAKTNSFLHLIIGTGLGSAFAKKVNSKWEVIPAELCLMIVNPDDREHSSSKIKGQLEAYTGGKELEINLKKPLKDIPDSHKIWDEVAYYLAIGIVNSSILLNPEIVTFSGGLIDKRPFLVKKVQQGLKKFVNLRMPFPKVMLSKVTGNTALLGALALIKLNLNK